MRVFLAAVVIALVAGCSGGSGSSVSEGVAATWPAKWCQAQPGISKVELTRIMGKPTQASDTTITWYNDNYLLNAFLEQDGTVRQLDANRAAEQAGMQCKAIRSLESMRAQAEPQPKRVRAACELVTQPQMSDILGTPVIAEPSGRSKCTYKAAGPTGLPYAEFEYAPGDGAAGMAGAGFAGSGQPGMTSPYDGIGDQAVAVGPALFIRTGDDLATIVLSGVKDRRTAAKRILDTAKAAM